MKKLFKKRKTVKGFSLMELVVSIFMFTIIVTSAAATFSGSFISFRKARVTQRNLEDAQYAMNLMAKTLRTSSIIFHNPTTLRIFDYSQGRCILYRFEAHEIRMGSENVDIADCLTEAISVSRMTSNYLNAVNFDVTESAANVVGRVTIGFEICQSNGDCSEKINIQTSVSLRDYMESDLY